MTKDGAVAWTRFLLHCLTVAVLALGIASAPLYAVAQAEDGTMAVQAHHGHMAHVTQGAPDHDHVSLAKHHAMGQTCCHPDCIMAVVPPFTSLTTAPVPWTTLAIPRDRGIIPVTPPGLDRPPKLA
jgi:hypothetical protein